MIDILQKTELKIFADLKKKLFFKNNLFQAVLKKQIPEEVK